MGLNLKPLSGFKTKILCGICNKGIKSVSERSHHEKRNLIKAH